MISQDINYSVILKPEQQYLPKYQLFVSVLVTSAVNLAQPGVIRENLSGGMAHIRLAWGCVGDRLL